MSNLFKNRSPQSIMMLVLTLGLAIGIIPFTLYRLIQQDWHVATIDSVVFVGLLSLFFYIYKTDNVKTAGSIFIILALMGNVSSFYVKGITQVYWVYPVMLSAYYILPAKRAIIINSIMISLYIPKLISVTEVVIFSTILFTIVFTNIVAYVFSSGLRNQEIKLKKLASEDYLTSTGNRRSLDDAMNKLYQFLKNHDNTASIILLDLDHFKLVNDTYGHIKGDEVLVRLSELLFNFFKNKESIFRYGGEEFLVICKNTSKEKAHELAEEFRVIVKNNIVIEKKQQTISLGVCEYTKEESIDEWIHRVDMALYQAKKQGRDRTISA